MNENRKETVEELNKRLEIIDSQLDTLRRERQKDKKIRKIQFVFTIIIGIIGVSLAIMTIVLMSMR